MAVETLILRADLRPWARNVLAIATRWPILLWLVPHKWLGGMIAKHGFRFTEE